MPGRRNENTRFRYRTGVLILPQKAFTAQKNSDGSWYDTRYYREDTDFTGAKILFIYLLRYGPYREFDAARAGKRRHRCGVNGAARVVTSSSSSQSRPPAAPAPRHAAVLAVLKESADIIISRKSVQGSWRLFSQMIIIGRLKVRAGRVMWDALLWWWITF